MTPPNPPVVRSRSRDAEPGWKCAGRTGRTSGRSPDGASSTARLHPRSGPLPRHLDRRLLRGGERGPHRGQVQVRLEDLARHLPHLDVFHRQHRAGESVAVLRPLCPASAAGAVPNDFSDNSPVLAALQRGVDPDRYRPPWATAVRGADGGFELRPPDGIPPGFRGCAPTTLTHRRRGWRGAPGSNADGTETPRQRTCSPGSYPQTLELLSQRPSYEWLNDVRSWVSHEGGGLPAEEERRPSSRRDWRPRGSRSTSSARAERDGAALVILANHLVGRPGADCASVCSSWPGRAAFPVTSRQGGDPRAAS